MAGKIIVSKTFTFSAAHCLPGYDGPCKNLHGHNWKLEVGVSGPVNNEGFVIDFSELKNMVNNEIVSKIDHVFLNAQNDIPGFPYKNPTAENMLNWMAETLQHRFHLIVKLEFIKLWETDTSYAEWRNQ
jgi:6-pyruvoyltetrahydropterin/6-carboxytetrahydropterin synthase